MKSYIDQHELISKSLFLIPRDLYSEKYIGDLMKTLILALGLLTSLTALANIRVFDGLYEVKSGTGNGCFDMEVRYDDQKQALLVISLQYPNGSYYHFDNINKGKQPWQQLSMFMRNGTQETKFNGVDTLTYEVKEGLFFTPEKMSISIKANTLTIKNKTAPDDCVLTRTSR